MTDEQLKKLARAYAVQVCPSDDYPDMKDCEDDRIIEYDFALPVLRWLAKNYELTEKK